MAAQPFVFLLTQFGWQAPLAKVQPWLRQKALVHSSPVRAGKKVIQKKMRLYRVMGDHIYLPRFFPIEKAIAHPFGLRVALPEPRAITFPEEDPRTITLTADQRVVFDYLMDVVYTEDNMSRGTAGCTLVMETGLGKTYMAGALIRRLAMRTLVVVPNTNIRRGWERMLANLPLTVAVHGESEGPGDVTLIIVNSAAKDEIDGQHYAHFFSGYGLVVMDEVHNYLTPSYVSVLWRTNFRAALYLTATPERLDGMHAVLPHFGGEIIRASEIEGFNGASAVPADCILKQLEYHGPDEYTRYIAGPMGVDAGATVRMLESDPDRLEFVVRAVREQLDGGAHVLVFAENRAYAEQLATRTGAVLLIGGATEEESTAARTHNAVVTTYAFGLEGLSLSQMDTLVLATPRRNRMHQLCGRILRRDGDMSRVRTIVDIVDVNVRLRNQSSARRAAFRERGFREVRT